MTEKNNEFIFQNESIISIKYHLHKYFYALLDLRTHIENNKLNWLIKYNYAQSWRHTFKLYYYYRNEFLNITNYKNWKPTSENINNLPEPIRKYIHNLETNCDPAGLVSENICLKENCESLQIKIKEEKSKYEKFEKYILDLESNWKDIYKADDERLIIQGIKREFKIGE
jgi:hypothetical protein